MLGLSATDGITCFKRAREAALFRRVTDSLIDGLHGDDTARRAALAPNRLLWSALTMLLSEKPSALPLGLRAALISLGLAVQREMRRASPDLRYLVEINEQIIAGLNGS